MIAEIISQIAILFLALFKDVFKKRFRNETIYYIIVGVLIFVIFAFQIILTISNNKQANDKIAASNKYAHDTTLQYDTLKSQYDTLKAQYAVLKGSSESNILLTSNSYLNLKEQNLFLQKQLFELNQQISPFIKLATEKYPNLDTSSALVQFRKEINDVKESIKPMMLTYVSHKIEKINGGYNLTIYYKRNKDEQLGRMIISAEIDKISNAIIADIDVLPTETMGESKSGIESGDSQNKKYFYFSYSTTAAYDPSFVITIKGAACKIKVECNRLSKPEYFEIK